MDLVNGYRPESQPIFIFAIQKHKVTNMVAFRSPPAKLHIIFHPTKYFDDKTQKTHIIGVSPGILENSLCLSIFYVVLKLDKTFYNIPNVSFKHPII